MIFFAIQFFLIQSEQPNFTSSLLDRAYVLGYADVGYQIKGKEKSNMVLFQKVGHEMQPMLAWTNPHTGEHLSYFSEFHHMTRHPETGQIAFIGAHRLLNKGKVGLFVLDPDGSLTLFGRVTKEEAKFKGTPDELFGLRGQARTIKQVWDFSNGFDRIPKLEVDNGIKDMDIDADLWADSLDDWHLTLLWSPTPNQLVLISDSNFIQLDIQNQSGRAVDLSAYRRRNLAEEKNFLNIVQPARLEETPFLYTPGVVYQLDYSGRLRILFSHKGRWNDAFEVFGAGIYFRIGKSIYASDGRELFKLPKKDTQVFIQPKAGLMIYAIAPKTLTGLDLTTQQPLPKLKTQMPIQGMALSANGDLLFVLESVNAGLKNYRFSQYALSESGFVQKGDTYAAEGVFPSEVGAFFKTEKGLLCMDENGSTCEADLPLVKDMAFAILVDGEVIYSDIPFTDYGRITAMQVQRNMMTHMMMQQQQQWFQQQAIRNATPPSFRQ
ncbi:MAG: hypothetical protein H6510_07200 [Acidobacteria bacterium]|nr:hypothetical protein [Acidobacteriota bacterium]MCB9397582.1 hypothetical protein [Acidobacteriota bacterium]